MYVCMYVSIGLSEYMYNVALSVLLHAIAAHGLSVSGFLKLHLHTFAMTP